MAQQSTATLPRTHGFRLAGWRAALGTRLQLATLTLLAAAVAAAAGYSLLARSYSPEGAVRDYLAASERGDVSQVWADSVIAAPAGKVDASLLDRRALQASLALPSNRGAIPGWQVNGANLRADRATVDVSYRAGAAVRHLSLTAIPDSHHQGLGLFRRWLVLVNPAELSLAPPPNAGAASIDGLPVETGVIAVFPGVHHLALAGSNLFLPDDQDVTVVGGSPAVVTLNLRLTDGARANAGAVLKDAFGACAAITVLEASQCPQGIIDVAQGPVSWTLVGDPLSGVSYPVAADGSVSGQGHFQMAASYQSQTLGAQRQAVGGGYQARLSWSGDKFTVTTIDSVKGVPAASRPAVDDSAVAAAVKTAFDSCAASTSSAPAGCPQAALILGATNNFAWKLDSDPMAGATVSFDGDRSMFVVSGNYSMTANWTETYPYDPNPHPRTKTSSGSYLGDLFWDGQKVVFVAFEHS
jgi:hypothetical protein